MNPKFERFLKETKEDQLKKERAENKKQREGLKQEKLAAKAEEKRLKQEAREQAKANKLALMLLKKEAKELKKSQKASKATKASKKSADVLWQEDDLFQPDTTNVLPTKVLSQNPPVVPIPDPEDFKNIEEPQISNTKQNPDTTLGTALESSLRPKDNETLGQTKISIVTEKSKEIEPRSLHEMFKSEGDYAWLKPDSLAAKGAFNLINKTLHPDRTLARGVAIIPIKGSSFEDKRINCLNFLSEIRAGESTGEILLKPEPTNPFDPNAVAVYDIKNDKMLGYIPKAHEINASYAKSLNDEKFCGGYVIEGKNSMLKGEENAMILIATGWV